MKHSFDRKGWGYGYQTDLGPASGIHFHIGKIKINQHIIFFFFFFSGWGFISWGDRKNTKRQPSSWFSTSSLQRWERTGMWSKASFSNSHHLQGLPLHLSRDWFLFFFLSVPEHTGSTLICSSTICPFCLFKDRSSMMLYMGLIRSLLKPLKAKAFWIAKQFPLLHLVREHFFLAS